MSRQSKTFVVTQGVIVTGGKRNTAGMKVKLAVDSEGLPDVSVRSKVDLSRTRQKAVEAEKPEGKTE